MKESFGCQTPRITSPPMPTVKPPRKESEGNTMEKTKGEILLLGLEQVREGLELISQHGDQNMLLRTLVGSTAAAKRLREVVRDSAVFRSMVMTLVCARNSRLSAETVEKVVRDFLDVMFDLSQPYRDNAPSSDEGQDAQEA
jgi:hypothetical protein